MDITHIHHIEAAIQLSLGYANIKGFQLQAVDALLKGKRVFVPAEWNGQISCSPATITGRGFKTTKS